MAGRAGVRGPGEVAGWLFRPAPVAGAADRVSGVDRTRRMPVVRAPVACQRNAKARTGRQGGGLCRGPDRGTQCPVILPGPGTAKDQDRPGITAPEIDPCPPGAPSACRIGAARIANAYPSSRLMPQVFCQAADSKGRIRREGNFLHEGASVRFRQFRGSGRGPELRSFRLTSQLCVPTRPCDVWLRIICTSSSGCPSAAALNSMRRFVSSRE